MLTTLTIKVKISHQFPGGAESIIKNGLNCPAVEEIAIINNGSVDDHMSPAPKKDDE